MAKNRKPQQTIQKVLPASNKIAYPQPQKKGNSMEIKIDDDFVRISDEEKKCIARLQELRNSKIITFIASDTVQLNDDVSLKTYELLRELGNCERIDMILNSRGGQTEVPANLVPLIRNYCNHFGVIIPYRAHSAATHLAIGANEIVMGPMSELGPVDPSRSHPLLPKDKDGNPIPISVQDLKHVVDLLKREGPAENYTPEALATIFSTMFQYIHPLAMGAIEQSYALAKSISIKLLSTHMDPENEKDRIEHIANALSDSFKSHLYQISWKEAKALGLPILYDNGEIYQQAWQLYEMIIQKLNNPPANPTGAKIVSHPIMVIGTEKSKYVLFELSEVIPEGALTKFKPLGANWISSNTLDAKKAEETVPTAEKS